MKKNQLRTIILSSIPLAFAGFMGFSANSSEKPNFIIILTDDQGYNDLGCYGSPLIRTPNIDKMASEGIRFTNFYAQPVCGPARAALMTGSYPLRVAELGNIKRPHPVVHPDEIMLPEILKDVGYTTGCIGKWHMGFTPDTNPLIQGFDYWFGLPGSNDVGAKNMHRNNELIGEFPVDTLTRLYTSEAISFIEKNQDSPFFLYLAHTMPHTILGASKQFKGKSAFGLYGDAIEELDWSVGKIMDKLEELGLDENSIVLYTSDNGPWRARGTHGGSAFPLRSGKVTTWEGGVRVPAIIWGPGLILQGKVSDQVCSVMDIMPTFASMADAALPDDRHIDGQDIGSVLTGTNEEKPLKEIYFYYLNTHLQAVREGHWKLVLPRPQAPEWLGPFGKISIWIYEDQEPVRDFELYNLKKDISERRDVAPEHPEKVRDLKKLIEKARDDIGDYNRIGTGARFFDEGVKRPDAVHWDEKEKGGWKQEIIIHRFYDCGARNL